MLRLVVQPDEWFDERTQEFINFKGQTLQLEHSLVSLSKWESKWEKPFFSRKEKTLEETLDYVRCMTLTQNVDPSVYYHLRNADIAKVNKYIEKPMTASIVPKGKPGREQVTAELIYYWMISLNIPFECQKWHLNRLLTLIEVCDYKNKPPKKMSSRDIMRRNSALNAARKKQYHTKG